MAYHLNPRENITWMFISYWNRISNANRHPNQITGRKTNFKQMKKYTNIFLS